MPVVGEDERKARKRVGCGWLAALAVLIAGAALGMLPIAGLSFKIPVGHDWWFRISAYRSDSDRRGLLWPGVPAEGFGHEQRFDYNRYTFRAGLLVYDARWETYLSPD